MVPVIHDVPSLTLHRSRRSLSELIDRARKGNLPIADSQGSTFTVTNLGAFGIDAFTPVIDTAGMREILGLGRIQGQVVPVGDRFVFAGPDDVEPDLDHRIVDGAGPPAARFLQNLAAMIENPSPWLLA